MAVLIHKGVCYDFLITTQQGKQNHAQGNSLYGRAQLAGNSLTNSRRSFEFSDSTRSDTFAAGKLSEDGNYAVAWHSWRGAEGWIVDDLGKQYRSIQTNQQSEDLRPSQIFSLEDDQFVIIYNKIGRGSTGGFGQVYDSNGVMLGETVKLTDNIGEYVYSHSDVWAAKLANGNIVVAWTEVLMDMIDDDLPDSSPGESNIYARIFSPSLQQIGETIRVDTEYSYGYTNRFKDDVRITAFDNGEFVVMFERSERKAERVFGRRFDEYGQPKRDREFNIGFKAETDHEPKILTLSNHRYIVAWTIWDGDDPYADKKTFIQVMSGTDKRLGEPYVLSHEGDTNLEIEGLTKRSALNFWVSYGYEDGLDYNLATQAFTLGPDNTLTSLMEGNGLTLATDVTTHDDEEYNSVPERAGILLNFRANRYVSISSIAWGGLYGSQFRAGDCNGSPGDWTQLCSLPAPESEDELR
ncbi:hypothetical protein [Hahella ganghwensis]|uniref:hypothetical protein n=1 Tax=Hahella ganghwensis TaxID=286420 RepID=UPI00037DDAFD|nr:hypothetical protein [Hahella ganghwensis]